MQVGPWWVIKPFQIQVKCVNIIDIYSIVHVKTPYPLIPWVQRGDNDPKLRQA